MSGGGSSGGGGLDWGSIARMFGGQQSNGQSSPFSGQRMDPNAPWSGMTFQQSMGLYPRGTFQGQGPAPGTNPGAPASWGQAGLPGMAGGAAQPALPNRVLSDPLGAMRTFATGPQATSYGGPNVQAGLSSGGQPFQGPADYSAFANLAVPKPPSLPAEAAAPAAPQAAPPPNYAPSGAE